MGNYTKYLLTTAGRAPAAQLLDLHYSIHSLSGRNYEVSNEREKNRASRRSVLFQVDPSQTFCMTRVQLRSDLTHDARQILELLHVIGEESRAKSGRCRGPI